MRNSLLALLSYMMLMNPSAPDATSLTEELLENSSMYFASAYSLNPSAVAFTVPFPRNHRVDDVLVMDVVRSFLTKSVVSIAITSSMV